MLQSHRIDDMVFHYSPAKRGYYYSRAVDDGIMIQELGFIPVDSIDTLLAFLQIIKEERANI